MEEKLLFGKYKIKGKLGQGGMAIVYRAYDPDLEREVAIKALLPKYKDNVNVVKMFLHEGQLMAKLDDPHIVKVYVNTRHNDHFYYVMEFVDGNLLKDLIQKGLSYDESEIVFKEILLTLSYIHKKEILHLDLKPSNILIERSGQIKITDFGIGTLLDGKNIRENFLAGTVKYIAPEQIKNEKIGFFTDIYQLGIILYEMYSGETPYRGTNEEIMKSKVELEPPTLDSINHNVPEYISSICAKMLRIDPQDRFKNVDEVLDELDQLKTYSISPIRNQNIAPEEIIVPQVYGCTGKNKKRTSPPKLVKRLIAYLILILFLCLFSFAYIIFKVNDLSNYPFKGLFITVKELMIENYDIFQYDQIKAFGYYLKDNRKFGNAERIFQVSLEKYPDREEEILKDLFLIYISQQNSDKIGITGDLIIEKYGSIENIFIYIRMGDHFKDSGQKFRANKYYINALNLDPPDYYKSEIHKRLSEPEK